MLSPQTMGASAAAAVIPRVEDAPRGSRAWVESASVGDARISPPGSENILTLNYPCVEQYAYACRTSTVQR